MFELATLPGSLEGLTTVGIVLAEALLLHVGYGRLTRVAGPNVEAALSDE